MKSLWIIWVVAALLLIGGAYFLMQKPAANNNPGTGQSQGNNMEIANFAFSPSTLIIKQGETVVWTNKDSAKHTVTSDSGSELDSPQLVSGETYSHTFNSKGTFDYHCTPHPYMKAKIIVE